MSTKTKGDILAETVEAFLKPYGVPVSDLRKAIADYHKPWTLGRSVNGFTLGEGQEWHRNDWTEDMLPDGWRPLIKGEIIDCEVFCNEGWIPRIASSLSMGAASNHFYHRTRRPLPPFKPAPKLVPLGPDDVKCGDELRYIAGHFPSNMGEEWLSFSINAVGRHCISASNTLFSYEKLREDMEINRNDGRGFVRCEKEAK